MIEMTTATDAIPAAKNSVPDSEITLLTEKNNDPATTERIPVVIESLEEK